MRSWRLGPGWGVGREGDRLPSALLSPNTGLPASPRSSPCLCCTACGRRASWPPWTTLWSAMPAPSPSTTRWARPETLNHRTQRGNLKRWAPSQGLLRSLSGGWPVSCQVSLRIAQLSQSTFEGLGGQAQDTDFHPQNSALVPEWPWVVAMVGRAEVSRG